MKISDILKQNRLLLSFEVFPPKSNYAFESVKEAVRKVAALGPAFMSVTYGAGGGTSKNTAGIQDIRHQGRGDREYNGAARRPDAGA